MATGEDLGGARRDMVGRSAEREGGEGKTAELEELRAVLLMLYGHMRSPAYGRLVAHVGLRS